jgi:hypothetical protein
MPQGSKVAMLSYNTFLRGRPNGWVGDTLFVIQNDNGSKWGAPQFGPLSQRTELQAKGDQQIKDKVGGHWQQLAEHIPTLDTVVIYVGDRGSEHTIEHAAAHGLDPDKAVFVLCDCNMPAKQANINKHGFSRSKRIMCECGGHTTMQQMAERFIATGDIA